MEAVTYKLEQFEGPLDLLLSLIQKSKVNIEDIPIAVLCDQYLEYIRNARETDMELAGEFIVMASELMLIKSRVLLPKATDGEEKDPRQALADALLRYSRAKQAALKMAALYSRFSGRMVKDTDEISVDTSYVADQQVTSLCAAVRRIIAANESRPRAEKQVFAPMIAKPIVPVEVKIVGILHHVEQKKQPTMEELLDDAVSLPDMIAIFLGILELVKVRKLLILESPDRYTVIHGTDTQFVINDAPTEAEAPGKEKKSLAEDDAPIPLSSKAEMHREQRRILRERKLEEKKRLRAEERARRAAQRQSEKEQARLSTEEELPEDDSDLENEAKIAELLDNRLSESDEDLIDDLGLDMNEIIESMQRKAKKLSE